MFPGPICRLPAAGRDEVAMKDSRLDLPWRTSSGRWLRPTHGAHRLEPGGQGLSERQLAIANTDEPRWRRLLVYGFSRSRFVPSVLIGAGTPQQFESTLGTRRLEITRDELQSVDAMTQPAATYPRLWGFAARSRAVWRPSTHSTVKRLRVLPTSCLTAAQHLRCAARRAPCRRRSVGSICRRRRSAGGWRRLSSRSAPAFTYPVPRGLR